MRGIDHRRGAYLRTIDADTLASWGTVELSHRAPSGHVNEVWFATVEGEACVVRTSTRSNDALQWELDLIAQLRKLGLGVPQIVTTRDGRASVDGTVVFRRAGGERPTTAAHWALVRDYLGHLHESLRPARQRPGFLSSVDLLVARTGGLVDLADMPEEVVVRCRRAWERLVGLPQTVVHGDPGADNVFVASGQVVLIDWDEARVDVALFDLAALPDDVCPLSREELWVARQAASAWEAAITWCNDREYALWRLSEVEPS